MTTEIIVATRSVGKIRELIPLVREFGFRALSLDDAGIAVDPIEESLEQFETFEENALAKARWFHALGNGRAVIADDSGLQVDALEGLPGVRSKRWSGRNDLDGEALDAVNNQYLWSQLDARNAAPPITARYVCAASCVSRFGEFVVRGITSGNLIREPRGKNGFGYDPYFLSDELSCTFGEASRDEKAVVSHRGRAFRTLLEQMMSSFARALSHSAVDPKQLS